MRFRTKTLICCGLSCFFVSSARKNHWAICRWLSYFVFVSSPCKNPWTICCWMSYWFRVQSLQESLDYLLLVELYRFRVQCLAETLDSSQHWTQKQHSSTTADKCLNSKSLLFFSFFFQRLTDV